MKDGRVNNGSKSKLPRFMEEMKKILANPNTFTLTYKELHTYVNHQLKKDEKVIYKTFMKWISPTKEYRVENLDSVTEEQAIEFRELIEYAKVKQKINLTEKMMDDERGNKWGTAWLFERTFADMRLNQKIELGAGGFTLQIEGGNGVQDALDAIDVDFEDITGEVKRISK